MRIQIFIRDELAHILNDLAWRENRWPKQQAEWLLQKALEQAAQVGHLEPGGLVGTAKEGARVG